MHIIIYHHISFNFNWLPIFYNAGNKHLTFFLNFVINRFAYSEDGYDDFDYEELHSPARNGSFSFRENWSYSMSPDTKVILRSDSIIYKVTDLDEEDKRE